jgi:hypothetical protein
MVAVARPGWGRGVSKELEKMVTTELARVGKESGDERRRGWPRRHARVSPEL